MPNEQSRTYMDIFDIESQTSFAEYMRQVIERNSREAQESELRAENERLRRERLLQTIPVASEEEDNITKALDLPPRLRTLSNGQVAEIAKSLEVKPELVCGSLASLTTRLVQREKKLRAENERLSARLQYYINSQE